MKVTRQAKNTERRLVITLARHERHTTKTEILSRVKHQKNNIVIAQEFGANVYHETSKGGSKYLYTIPPFDFHNKRDQLRPDQVQQLAEYVRELREIPSEPFGVLSGNGTDFVVRDYGDNTRRVVGVDLAEPGKDWSASQEAFPAEYPFKHDIPGREDLRGREVEESVKSQYINRGYSPRIAQFIPGTDGNYSPRIDDKSK